MSECVGETSSDGGQCSGDTPMKKSPPLSLTGPDSEPKPIERVEEFQWR